MADEFPGNSKRDRERGEKQRQPEKKVERVAQGEVLRRKKPLGKRMKETFFGGDGRGVWEFITGDVLIPSLKDLIADVVTQGIERMIFEDGRSHSRRGRRDPRGHTRYDRYSRRDRDEPRQMSRRGRASHDFDEIILDSRVEAEEVIDHLYELVNQFEQASVADLYELIGVSGNYTDQKWGWEDLRGAGVTRLPSGGYLLDLPRPDPLD